MSPAARCPDCGAELSSGELGNGMCPRCVLGLALTPDDGADQSTRQQREPPPALPRQIGPYRILQKIGEGGMGLDKGRYDEAESFCVEALETQKRVFGDDHLDTLISMNNLGVLYEQQSRYDEAEKLYVENLEAHRRVLGDVHSDTALSLYNLACFEGARGNRAKGMDWLRQAIDANFARVQLMTDDPDLEPLRHDPEFDAIVERVRQHAADQQAK